MAVLLGVSSLQAQSDDYQNDRRLVLKKILADLRVFVDLDPAHMPHNELDGDLKPEEVHEAVALGIGNWATLIPGFHFKLVDSAGAANLVIRFRAYGTHISGNSTAISFLPSMWKVDSGSYNFDCGSKVFGKLPSGETCSETSNNMILFQLDRMAFRRVHFSDARMYYQNISARSDRTDSTHHFFRFLPDAHYQTWPPNRTSCVGGGMRNGVLPSWDIQCVADSDWASFPRYKEFGRWAGPNDLGSLIEHEFGHTLIGQHTAESDACPKMAPNHYEDFSRNPVYLPEQAIRKIHWENESSYSIMFPGNALDAAFNVRGVYEFDGRRLGGLRFTPECKEVIGYSPFLTSYPKVNGWIVLQRRNGETKYVNDWRYAHRLMAWPLSSGQPDSAVWFQTGILPAP